MSRLKSGKNIRITEQSIEMMSDLRAVMLATSHIGGLKLSKVANLSDGTVVGFALAMTLMLMKPEMALRWLIEPNSRRWLIESWWHGSMI